MRQQVHQDEEEEEITSQIANRILGEIEVRSVIPNSRVFAAEQKLEYEMFVRSLKRLEGFDMVVAKVEQEDRWVLTPEAQEYVKLGASMEALLFKAVPEGGILKSELKMGLAKTYGTVMGGTIENVGLGTCMKNKWVKQEKKSSDLLIVRLVESIDDSTFQQMHKIHAQTAAASESELKNLKAKKMVQNSKEKYFVISRGPNYATQLKKEQADITSELLQNGGWKTENFKAYNFNAMGKQSNGGHLHVLLKMRTEFRNIFLEMGFEEMKTNNFVESSFWNFDALFQPQAHPARDAHDTFFLEDPSTAQVSPQDYVQRVHTVHEQGGYGSIGYRYKWKVEEAKKNILRTHTTAVSSRYLYQYAQDIKEKGFFPKKFFSIDRVFRNEVLDATHLCEFHQVEGMVIDKGLSLGDLIGLFSTFFNKIGITQLKFKPAYNPYTEPSMEIFGFHPQLNRWVEVGNSGVFRPEMLEPMGIPSDVVILAWGVSLERPTMILHGYDNIRDLVGHKVPIKFIRENPIVRLDKKRRHRQKVQQEQ